MEEHKTQIEEIAKDTEKVSEKPEKVNDSAKEQEKDIKIPKKTENEQDVLEERKKKVIGVFKNKQLWVILLLIVALVLGIYIRSLPMQDHGGKPGLWDITTNTWTLGPDLDPWLFERYAEIIVENGSLPNIDYMRNVPLGFDVATESMLLPYMIDWTYHLLNTFMDAEVMYAAVIFPVIMFALTIIAFFLFVREIFINKSKENKTKANIISIISTFFMIVIPVLLPRTVAGIPEKESAAFFFMFMAFYLFLKSWKSEDSKKSVVFGILSGIATGCMGLVWGGVLYVFITISSASLIAFILNKVQKKEFISYALWLITSFFLIIIFSNKFPIMGLITSLDTGLSTLVLFIFIVHFIINKTKLHDLNVIKESKIPSSILSMICAMFLFFIIILIGLGPDFIIEKIKAIHQVIFRPITGRWNITVAENRQPYFGEWVSEFGPFVKGVPLLFWSFVIGSIVFFKKMLNSIKNKDSWILTSAYVLFLFGLIFSRYSPSSLFNGDNFISKSFYYSSAIILMGIFIYYQIKYHKEGNKSFEKVSYSYLVLFALFILCLFTAKSAVRLIMVLGLIAPIFVGYLAYESASKFKKTSDETLKFFLGIIFILILVMSIFAFFNFYKTIKNQASSYVPSMYNYQWQKSMNWVRENTSSTSVFAHWWDYGYWVQSIGKRATVLDGGNAITYWNYLIGRLVLTGDNEKDALEFLYNHNTTHFLIDSSDIGKYTAFSSIGSNENFDRYSWFGTFLLDEKQIKETKNQTFYVYSGGVSLDEDLPISEGGEEILLPTGRAGVAAIILPMEKINDTVKFSQPYIIAVDQGRQYNVNLKYLYADGKFFDFNSGIEATAYIFPSLNQQGQGINSNPFGAAMYISPRLMRGMFSQIYLLGDPFKKFSNFKLVHSEPNLIIDNLHQQGMNLPEFVYFQGVQGPIKIWEIEYTGKEEIKQEYLDTDPTKHLSWKL